MGGGVRIEGWLGHGKVRVKKEVDRKKSGLQEEKWMDEKSEDNLYKIGWMRKVRIAGKDRITEKGPDGGKRSGRRKKTGRRSPPVYRGRGPRSGEGVQKQRYENLGKWIYILIFDCGEVVKNTHSMQTTHYSCTPSPQSGPLPL